MRSPIKSLLLLHAAVAIAATPCLAESKPKPKHQDDGGVQEAIAFERAKDRADAAQARKEARHPEQFTYATPQKNPPDSLATEQRRQAMEKSEKRADGQPEQRK